MNAWIPVFGTLLGTLVGALIAWRMERLRSRLNAEAQIREEKARAYSVFLSSIYQFLISSQQIGEIGQLTSRLTAPRNLRFLERSGLAASSTSAKDAFMEGYTLVLIWGSEVAKTFAEELLAEVQLVLDEGDSENGGVRVGRKRAAFLKAVHEDLGITP